MEKRLEKTIKEEAKLKTQMEALQQRIKDTECKRATYEKEELHRNFKETEISLEEYQMIIRNAVDDYMGSGDDGSIIGLESTEDAD